MAVWTVPVNNAKESDERREKEWEKKPPGPTCVYAHNTQILLINSISFEYIVHNFYKDLFLY